MASTDMHYKLWSWPLVVVFLLAIESHSVWCVDDCFQIASEKCILNSASNCKCGKLNEDLSFCCNITSLEELKASINCADIQQATALHIRDSNFTRLDATIFSGFQKLVSLSITASFIAQLHGSFKSNSLTCLDISHNNMNEIDPEVVYNLHSIFKLDLSYNNLSALPKIHPIVPRLILDISNNSRLQCKSLLNFFHLNAMKENDEWSFINKETTTCRPPKSSWITDEVDIPFEAVENIKEIYRDCPQISGTRCDCDIQNLDYLENRKYVYQATVDCSNRQITSLPLTLPSNTKFLNISNNNITSLDGIGNKTYSSIQELYADGNWIDSMKELEGSQFLYNFKVLSLKGNRISMLRTYMFSSIFDRNLAKKIFLANNRINCDCSTALHTKTWLIANSEHIPDNEELWCNNLHNTRVVELDHRLVCVTNTDWTDYIHYVIALEIVLFILLIGKVSYDYYVFKTAGHLPWPASKMPKLPCDWCFET